MKDFDVARREREQRDRSFMIGGEKFVYRASVAPESILQWSEFSASGDQERAELAASQAALVAANARDAEPQEIATMTAEIAAKTAAVEKTVRPETEWVTVVDQTILALVEPEYAKKWKKVRDPNLPHPLGLPDLQELLQWLIGEVVTSPTGKPSVSSHSDGNSETVSKEESSSVAEQESKASAPASS